MLMFDASRLLASSCGARRPLSPVASSPMTMPIPLTSFSWTPRTLKRLESGEEILAS